MLRKQWFWIALLAVIERLSHVSTATEPISDKSPASSESSPSIIATVAISSTTVLQQEIDDHHAVLAGQSSAQLQEVDLCGVGAWSWDIPGSSW